MACFLCGIEEKSPTTASHGALNKPTRFYKRKGYKKQAILPATMYNWETTKILNFLWLGQSNFGLLPARNSNGIHYETFACHGAGNYEVLGRLVNST